MSSGPMLPGVAPPLEPQGVAECPYPGLRPFQEKDAAYFCGQDEQIEVLYRELGRKRFVTVMGASGCGKSSLVRAGLIPLLRGGGSRAAQRWVIVVTRPGSDPIGNLVRKLASPTLPFGANAERIEDALRRTELGLLEVAREAALPEEKRVIVIVDQFEDLFRFRRKNPGAQAQDDAAFFVKLLLEGA